MLFGGLLVLILLLLIPGEGSVIYRGLAAVIVGGMLVSTVFTIILLPALLRVGGTELMQRSGGAG